MKFKDALENVINCDKIRVEFLNQHNCSYYDEMVEHCDKSTIDIARKQCEDTAIAFRQLSRAANAMADIMAKRSDMLSKSMFN